MSESDQFYDKMKVALIRAFVMVVIVKVGMFVHKWFKNEEGAG